MLDVQVQFIRLTLSALLNSSDDRCLTVKLRKCNKYRCVGDRSTSTLAEAGSVALREIGNRDPEDSWVSRTLTLRVTTLQGGPARARIGSALAPQGHSLSTPPAWPKQIKRHLKNILDLTLWSISRPGSYTVLLVVVVLKNPQESEDFLSSCRQHRQITKLSSTVHAQTQRLI